MAIAIVGTASLALGAESLRDLEGGRREKRVEETEEVRANRVVVLLALAIEGYDNGLGRSCVGVASHGFGLFRKTVMVF